VTEAYWVKVATRSPPLPVAGEVALLTGAAADEDDGKLGSSAADRRSPPPPPFVTPFSKPNLVPATGAALDTAEGIMPASAGEEGMVAAPVAVGSMKTGSAADEEFAAAVDRAPSEEANDGQGLRACSSHLPLWW